jgi:hypothetical protein
MHLLTSPSFLGTVSVDAVKAWNDPLYLHWVRSLTRPSSVKIRFEAAMASASVFESVLSLFAGESLESLQVHISGRLDGPKLRPLKEIAPNLRRLDWIDSEEPRDQRSVPFHPLAGFLGHLPLGLEELKLHTSTVSYPREIHDSSSVSYIRGIPHLNDSLEEARMDPQVGIDWLLLTYAQLHRLELFCPGALPFKPVSLPPSLASLKLMLFQNHRFAEDTMFKSANLTELELQQSGNFPETLSFLSLPALTRLSLRPLRSARALLVSSATLSQLPPKLNSLELLAECMEPVSSWFHLLPKNITHLKILPSMMDWMRLPPHLQTLIVVENGMRILRAKPVWLDLPNSKKPATSSGASSGPSHPFPRPSILPRPSSSSSSTSSAFSFQFHSDNPDPLSEGSEIAPVYRHEKTKKKKVMNEWQNKTPQETRIIDFSLPSSLTHLTVITDWLHPSQIPLLPPSLKILKVLTAGEWTDSDVRELLDHLPLSSFIALIAPIRMKSPPAPENSVFSLREYEKSVFGPHNTGRIRMEWQFPFQPSSSPPPFPTVWSDQTHLKKMELLFGGSRWESFPPPPEVALESLTKLRNLEEITFGCPFEETSPIPISAFKFASQLRKLNLDGTHAVMESLIDLPKSLTWLQADKLKKLDVADQLVDLAHLPPNLTHFHVGAKFLADTASEWPQSLKSLRIGLDGPWPDIAVLSLQSRLKNTESVVLDGTIVLTGDVFIKEGVKLRELKAATWVDSFNRLVSPVSVKDTLPAPNAPLILPRELEDLELNGYGKHQMMLPAYWPNGLTRLVLDIPDWAWDFGNATVPVESNVLPETLTSLCVTKGNCDYDPVTTFNPFKCLPRKLVYLSLRAQPGRSGSIEKSFFSASSDSISDIPTTLTHLDAPSLKLPHNLCELILPQFQQLSFAGGMSWTETKIMRLAKHLAPALQRLQLSSASFTCESLLVEDSNEISFITNNLSNKVDFVSLTKMGDLVLAPLKAHVTRWSFAMPLKMPDFWKSVDLIRAKYLGEGPPENFTRDQIYAFNVDVAHYPHSITSLKLQFFETVGIRHVMELPATLTYLKLLGAGFCPSSFENWSLWPQGLKHLEVWSTDVDRSKDMDAVGYVSWEGLPPLIETLVFPCYRVARKSLEKPPRSIRHLTMGPCWDFLNGALFQSSGCLTIPCLGGSHIIHYFEMYVSDP